MTLIAAACTTGIPSQISEPSPDRIGTTPNGQTIVLDELILNVSDDVTDPDEVARQAAAATEAEIIGSAPRLRLYQLQYPGATHDELEALTLVLEDLPGVDFVSRNAVLLDPSSDSQ